MMNYSDLHSECSNIFIGGTHLEYLPQIGKLYFDTFSLSYMLAWMIFTTIPVVSEEFVLL